MRTKELKKDGLFNRNIIKLKQNRCTMETKKNEEHRQTGTEHNTK